MKSKFLTAGLIAALMIPAAAQAQPRAAERNHKDARAVQYKPGNNAQHYAVQRDWRGDTRYQSWRAPFRYQQFRAGTSIRPAYFAPAYRLNYDSRWGVPRADRNMSYVRHYDDLLLVNVRTGKVAKVYRNHFRWR